MKLKNFRNIRPFVIPALIIGICIFWIVRLELNAAALASRVDDLHASLKKNQDVLNGLDTFERGVKNNSIMMDGSILELRAYLTALGLTDKEATIQMGDSWFFLNDKGVALSHGPNNESQVSVTGNGVKIKVGKGTEFYIEASPNSDCITIKKGDSKITIGKSSVATGSGSKSVEGVVLGEVSTGSIGVAKGHGVGIRSKDKKGINIQAGDNFYMKFLPQQDQILLKKGDSEIQVGKTQFGDGIAIGEANTATIAISNGKGLAMKAAGTNEVRITGEDKLYIQFDGEINIKAKGDVNIKSENGNVNLKGKRINLNE